MTALLVMLAAAMSLDLQAPAPQADAARSVILTGCVIAAADREDSFQLVPAESEPGRPVGTSGAAPVWPVSAYLLLGGTVSFAEHLNKTVEITGTIEPPGAPAEPDPKKTGDTTQRAQQAAAPIARLTVQSAKVVAGTCTPRKTAPIHKDK